MAKGPVDRQKLAHDALLEFAVAVSTIFYDADNDLSGKILLQ